MCLLFGQATLQVYVIVDYREVLLLQTDHLVSGLIDGRQGVVRIHHTILKHGYCQVAELHIALLANQCETTTAQHLALIDLCTIRLLRLCIAHHVCTIDLDRDILLTHSDVEIKPLSVFTQ